MLLLLIIIIGLCTVSGAIVVWMELSIMNDSLTWLEERLDVAFKKSLRQGDEDIAKYWDTHYNIVDSLISRLSLEKEEASE